MKAKKKIRMTNRNLLKSMYCTVHKKTNFSLLVEGDKCDQFSTSGRHFAKFWRGDYGYRFLTLRTRFLTLRTRFLALGTRFLALRTRFLALRTSFLALRTRFLVLRTRFLALRTRFLALRTRFLALRTIIPPDSLVSTTDYRMYH